LGVTHLTLRVGLRYCLNSTTVAPAPP
jgi:hypothetical protein